MGSPLFESLDGTVTAGIPVMIILYFYFEFFLIYNYDLYAKIISTIVKWEMFFS